MLGLGNIFRARKEVPEENVLEVEIKRLNEENERLIQIISGAENEIAVLNLTNIKLKEEIRFKDGIIINQGKELDVVKSRYFRIRDILEALRNLLTQDI